MREFCKVVLFAFAAAGAGADAADPNFCFAFVRGGDVFVSCEGSETQLTKQGTVNSFAVAEKQGVLGVATSWTVLGGNSGGLMDMDLAIDLKAAHAKFAGDGRKLVSTCGGLFGVVGTSRFPGRRNLLTGTDLPRDPYAWFRCSADRSTIAGIMESDRALYIGAAQEPGTQVAPWGGAAYYEFNMSPNGKYLAYASDRQPLCVWSAGVSECASANATDSSHDLVSVRDDGEVLVAVSTRYVCVYKSETVFLRRAPTIRMWGHAQESRTGGRE